MLIGIAPPSHGAGVLRASSASLHLSSARSLARLHVYGLSIQLYVAGAKRPDPLAALAELLVCIQGTMWTRQSCTRCGAHVFHAKQECVGQYDPNQVSVILKSLWV